MATMNETGRFFLFTDKSGKECPVGSRMVAVSWKITAAMEKKAAEAGLPKPVKHAAMAVYVPVLHSDIEIKPESIKGALLDAFDSLQDGLIAGWLNEQKDSKVSLSGLALPGDYLTVLGLSKLASAQAVSGRLTKEAIADWFMDTLAGDLTALALAVPNLGADKAVKAVKLVETYADGYASLANPNVAMSEKTAEKLVKQVRKVENPDKLTKQLTARLDGILKKLAADKAASDGFVDLG